MLSQYLGFEPSVSGITTITTEASVGAEVWSNRDYTISSMPAELIGDTLFLSDVFLDVSTITVEVNQNAVISVALYNRRTGGLDVVLPAQGWTLQNGWVIAAQHLRGFDIIYSKLVLAGQRVTFTSTTDDMGCMIFAKKG